MPKLPVWTLLPLAWLLASDAQSVPTAAGLPRVHWLGEDTEARCLDGSRYGYYFRPASSTNSTDKWVIELCVVAVLSPKRGQTWAAVCNGTAFLYTDTNDGSSWRPACLPQARGRLVLQ